MPVYKSKETPLRYNKKLRDKWYDANKPVIITDDSDKTAEYECKYCNRIIKGKLTPDSIWCNSCQLEIYLDDTTRKSLKSVKAHSTLDDKDQIFVNYPPNPNEEYMRKREPQLKGGFKELSKRGIKFTSYHDSSYGKEGAD